MDDVTKRGEHDRSRINLSQDDEVRDWTKSLGVDEHELRNGPSTVRRPAQRSCRRCDRFLQVCGFRLL
jgi:hypothetical protein